MADPASDLGDISSWVAIGFTLLGLIIQATSARSTNKDKKAFQQKLRIEQLLTDIDDLCAKAISYWMKTEDASGVESLLIVSKVKDISARTRAYESFLWTEAPTDFAKIKIKGTGGNFQVRTRSTLTADSPLLRSLFDDAALFKEKLRKIHDSLDTVI